VEPVSTVVADIESWYSRAPHDLSESETAHWVQRHAEIPCPNCGELLWVMRTQRAQNRGYYHLAMCQSQECTFQLDD
jgi:predicted RNA-binding Zn-ribbon protein involved in translation (DUF1610 family)